MKKIFFYTVITAFVVITNSCELEKVVDPNFADVDLVSKNATVPQLNDMVIGQFSLARNGLQTYTWVAGTIGKELFNFNGTESRWMNQLNGTRAISNTAFYNTATTAFGLPVRQANLLIGAANNAAPIVTDPEKNAYKGIANTFKGLAYLHQLNVQYKNGVRLDVVDPYNPSKTVSYEESLKGIAAFLDEGYNQLGASGANFPFRVPQGFSSFGTPAEFRKFNRAIALRVAIYQQDWQKAATLLPLTFFNETGDLNFGPSHTFSPSAPDFANPMVNTASQYIMGVHKIFDDIEPGDRRKNKVTVLDAPRTYTLSLVYSSKYLANMYPTGTTPVMIMRNEELVLIAAEVATQQGRTTDAVRYINIIRRAAGLGDYTGTTDKNALINAILKERLYSLWYEGHRWVDMRRYGKLNEIFLPLSNMKVYESLQRPAAEISWDVFAGN